VDGSFLDRIALGFEMDSQNEGDVAGREFIAEIRTRNRIIPWPFGRLEVSDAGITLRAWPAAWFQPREASRDSIYSVSATRMWNIIAIGFKTSDASLADVTVHVTTNYRRVIAELKRCGYPVDVQLDSIWKRVMRGIRDRFFR
jgi:hypothetical protein